MISERLEGWLTALESSAVTEVFIWLTMAVLCLSLYEANKGKHSQFLEYAPTLMTSLGILGTFIGVVIGLLHFDTENIDQSIPALLGGLKTAFITSVVGMTAAMFFNAMDAWRFGPKRALNGVGQKVTPEHIHATLEAQKALLLDLARGMNGQEEGSIIGQLKLLRSDISDFSRDNRAYNAEFSRKLWQELERFAEMMSKSATSQIIEALRQVIQDFNENLVEQFGENFKALDASVKKLVDWQAAYKEQVDRMGEQYQQSVESLVQTRTAVAGIWEECKEIPLAMAELKTVLEVNQHQISELQRHLETFIHMRDAAVQAVPTIQQKVEEIGDLLQAGATGLQSSLERTGQELLTNSNKMQVALEEGAEHFRDSVTSTQQAFSAMSKDVAEASEKLTESLNDTVSDMNASAKDLLDTMRRSVDDMGAQLQRHSGELTTQFKQAANEFEQSAQRIILQMGQSGSQAQQSLSSALERMLGELANSMSKARAELDAHVTDALKTFGEDVNSKLKLFETGTMRELNSELETVGVALTSITGRFVDDYQRLVGRMDDVIRSQPGVGV